MCQISNSSMATYETGLPCGYWEIYTAFKTSMKVSQTDRRLYRGGSWHSLLGQTVILGGSEAVRYVITSLVGVFLIEKILGSLGHQPESQGGNKCPQMSTQWRCLFRLRLGCLTQCCLSYPTVELCMEPTRVWFMLYVQGPSCWTNFWMNKWEGHGRCLRPNLRPSPNGEQGVSPLLEVLESDAGSVVLSISLFNEHFWVVTSVKGSKGKHSFLEKKKIFIRF